MMMVKKLLVMIANWFVDPKVILTVRLMASLKVWPMAG
jgi:hypothetical protein